MDASAEKSIAVVRDRIQRLLEEIAALGKADLPSEEFFAKYLERVVAACDAKGGAVWLVAARGQDNEPNFQLCAEVAFDSSLFRSDEGQRALLTKVLGEVAKDGRARVLGAAVATEMVVGDLAAGPMGGAVNRTPFAFIMVPLTLQGQPVGVLQVWLQPYVQPAAYAEFVTFVGSLASHVEQHLQSRRLSGMVLETQRLQHLLRFTGDLAGCLDALEVARLTANYARDMVGCERCAVLLHEGGQWRMLAVSGQEIIEQKSALVKAMTAFVGAHCQAETRILNKRELLPDGGAAPAGEAREAAAGEGGGREIVAAGQGIGAVDRVDLEYFASCHVVSAAMVPVTAPDPRGQQPPRVAGALFLESTREGFFEGPAPKDQFPVSYRLAQWIGGHAGKALLAARDYQTLPFLGVARAVRRGQLALTGERRRRTLVRATVALAALALVAAWPVKWKANGDCLLVPMERAAVVPEIPGRVKRIFVREGDQVAAGGPVAQLDTDRLATELEAAIQEKLRYLAEADRYRAPPLNDEASAQVALAQANIAGQAEKRLRVEIAGATLRSPIAGVVMSKGLELRVGEYLQPGAVLAEIGGVQRWELQADLDERDVGLVEQALAERGALPLPYILYAETAHQLETTLTDRRQISAAAYPRDKKNVFVVTVQDLAVPPDLLGHLRPGMTGKAKIVMGRAPVIVIVARNVTRWAQMRWIHL